MPDTDLRETVDAVWRMEAAKIVAQALSARRDNRRLAALLSASFTVVNYDRRGRGASTDAEKCR